MDSRPCEPDLHFTQGYHSAIFRRTASTGQATSRKDQRGIQVSDGQTSLVGGFELRNCVATVNATQIWEVSEQGGTAQFAMKLCCPKL